MTSFMQMRWKNIFKIKMAARSHDWWAWSCDQKITCDEYYIRAKFEVDRTNGVGLASTFRGEKKNNNNNNNNNNKYSCKQR